MGNIPGFENERKQLTERWLYAMAQVTTVENYNKFKEMIESWDDEMFLNEFNSMMQNMFSGENDYSKMTPEEAFNNLRELRKQLNITDENSAVQLLDLQFMSCDEAKEISMVLSQSKVTDVIKLTGKQDIELQKIWVSPDEIDDPYRILPSDIFFAKTIPIMDMIIMVDESDTHPEVPEPTCNYRVTILPNYDTIVDNLGYNECGRVGYITMEMPGLSNQVIMPITVTKGSNMITGGEIGFTVDEGRIDAFKKAFNQQNFSNFIFQLISTWYSIQIALLHPTVSEVFRKPKMEPIRKKTHHTSKKNGKKRPVKYVKVHTFDSITYERAMYGDTDTKTKHNMSKLAWYVIGHWRKYKDGKKIFIKPYWKGPLRDMKQAYDENTQRERVIYTTDDERKTISENIMKDKNN